FSTNVVIIMNEGGNTNSITRWNYSATVVSGDFDYLTFTENTNLAQIPIKFAIPPFINTNTGGSIFLGGFESPTAPGDYVAPAVVDNWNVLSTNRVSVIADPLQAHTGSQFLSLHQGQIERTLPTTPGRNYVVSCAARSPTNCYSFTNFNSLTDLSLVGNSTVVGGALRL